MGQVQPHQGQPRDQGETERGQRRPAQLDHAHRIIGGSRGGIGPWLTEARATVGPRTVPDSPIVSSAVPVYGAAMRDRLAHPQSRRLARLVMVALLAISTSISWASPMVGPHCESHSTAAHSPTDTDHDSGSSATPSWTPGPHHECSHCPPSECSRMAPCATTGSVAAAEAGTPIAGLPPHQVVLVRYIQQHRSTAVPPPTPPPQLIS